MIVVLHRGSTLQVYEKLCPHLLQSPWLFRQLVQFDHRPFMISPVRARMVSFARGPCWTATGITNEERLLQVGALMVI